MAAGPHLNHEDFPRPRVLVSRCLGFEACRWNGVVIDDPFVRRLMRHADFVPVCPEKEIGLPVPRDPVRVVRDGSGGRRLFQPATGRDLTDEMRRFSGAFLAALGPVDGAILKSRSPSCGVKDTKVYASGLAKAGVCGHEAGFFGAAVTENLPGLPVEDEGRLLNFTLREHFFTRLFLHARLRALRENPTMRALDDFQARHKLLLMACSQRAARALGRIAANPDRRPAAEVVEAYARALPAAFERPARFGAHINVLQHAMGYFSGALTAGEKAHFLDRLEEYRAGRLPLSACQTLLGSWIERFGQPYLGRQAYFSPYPPDLVEITDSGKGR